MDPCSNFTATCIEKVRCSLFELEFFHKREEKFKRVKMKEKRQSFEFFSEEKNLKKHKRPKEKNKDPQKNRPKGAPGQKTSATSKSGL